MNRHISTRFWTGTFPSGQAHFHRLHQRERRERIVNGARRRAASAGRSLIVSGFGHARCGPTFRSRARLIATKGPLGTWRRPSVLALEALSPLGCQVESPSAKPLQMRGGVRTSVPLAHNTTGEPRGSPVVRSVCASITVQRRPASSSPPPRSSASRTPPPRARSTAAPSTLRTPRAWSARSPRSWRRAELP